MELIYRLKRRKICRKWGQREESAPQVPSRQNPLRDRRQKKINKGQPINRFREHLAVVLCVVLSASSARADVVFDSLGFLEADSVKTFDDMRQHGLVLGFRVHSESKKFWIPTSLELSAGWLERNSDKTEFISFGPSYRLPLSKSGFGRWFTDFGSHPTYIAKSTFGGRSLGGTFFFTTYVGLGVYLDRERKTSALLRYQHTSNAGLDGHNPGVDMVGLNFSYHFGARQRLLSAEDTAHQ